MEALVEMVRDFGLVKGTDIPESTVPESFKVLVKELNSLALDVVPEGVVEKVVKEEAEPAEGESQVDFKTVKVKLDKASKETVGAQSSAF